MNKIVKLYSLQFVLIAALLCAIPIGGQYFYIPIIAGVIASICFYYTVKETIKKCEEVKDYNLKKHEEERKLYTDIIHSAEMISKENNSRIDEFEKTINKALKNSEKNNNLLAEKMQELILKAEKEIEQQHDGIKKVNGQLYAELKEFKDNYNTVSKNNLKMLSNEIKHYNSKLRDEIHSDNEKLLESLMENNNKNEEIFNSNCLQLVKALDENSEEFKAILTDKSEQNIRIIANSLRRLIENTGHIHMRLDDIKDITSEEVKERSNLNNKVIELFKNDKNSISKDLAKLVVDINNIFTGMKKENNSADYNEDKLEEVVETENNQIITDENSKVKEYSSENEHGIDYFINNKLIRHEDIDGSITEFEYDGEQMKQSIKKKNGEVIKLCSYVNGVLTEGKLFEDGEIKEQYIYDLEGEIKEIIK